MNNTDYVVQDKGPEFDRDTIHRKLFPVNIRLMKTSSKYCDLVKSTWTYMVWLLEQTWEDYEGRLTSISGATIGVPWNIIAFKVADDVRVMINPEIVERSRETVLRWTNNPSLRLPHKISLERNVWITVRYYTVNGDLKYEEKMDSSNGGLSVQHEVDANNGVMITDRKLLQIQGSSDLNYD